MTSKDIIILPCYDGFGQLIGKHLLFPKADLPMVLGVLQLDHRDSFWATGPMANVHSDMKIASDKYVNPIKSGVMFVLQ